MFFTFKYRGHYVSTKTVGNRTTVDVLRLDGYPVAKGLTSVHSAKCRITRHLKRKEAKR